MTHLLSFLFIFLVVIITTLIRYSVRENSMLGLFFIGVLSCPLVIITPEVIKIPMKYHVIILPVIFATPFLTTMFFMIKRTDKLGKIEREFHKRLRKLSQNPDIRKELEDISNNQNQ